MKDIKMLIEEIKKIQPLYIEELDLTSNRNIQLNSGFESDFIQKLTTTGKYLKENKIVLPIYDERKVHSNIPFWGWKFIDYRLEKVAPDAYRIIQGWGFYKRRSNEYKFSNPIYSGSNQFNFIFDFNETTWVQLEETDQRWVDKIKLKKDNDEAFIDFGKRFLLKLKEIKGNFFGETNKEKRCYFNSFYLFIREAKTYIDILFIWGDINSEEYHALKNEIKRLVAIILVATKYLKALPDDQQYNEQEDKLLNNRTNQVFGLVTAVELNLKKFVTARKLDPFASIGSDLTQGYIKQTSSKLFPNLAEIERRRNLTEDNWNDEKENELKMKLTDWKKGN